jgi:hypothetical protein
MRSIEKIIALANELENLRTALQVGSGAEECPGGGSSSAEAQYRVVQHFDHRDQRCDYLRPFTPPGQR